MSARPELANNSFQAALQLGKNLSHKSHIRAAWELVAVYNSLS